MRDFDGMPVWEHSPDLQFRANCMQIVGKRADVHIGSTLELLDIALGDLKFGSNTGLGQFASFAQFL